MRLPDMPLHDPFIVADKKTRTYYLYTSNDPSVSGVDGTGTMVYRSHDLRDWTRPVLVFLTAEQKGIWATDGGWAPEVHEWGGKYYLFTTLHNQDKPLPVPPPNQWGTPFRTPNYMRGTITAVSDSLLGPFTVIDPSRPTPPENLMTLDGTLYVDPSGQPWMVYAHEWLQTIDGTMGRDRGLGRHPGVADPLPAPHPGEAEGLGQLDRVSRALEHGHVLAGADDRGMGQCDRHGAAQLGDRQVGVDHRRGVGGDGHGAGNGGHGFGR
jgi:hypothetical protein